MPDPSSPSRPYLAVAVDEQGRLWGGHFGIAPVYYIYDRQGNLREKRPNPYGVRRGEKHTHHDDPKRIVNLLSDCGVFIGKRMGETSRRRLAENLGVQPVLTRAQGPDEAVRAYLATAKGEGKAAVD